LAAQKQSVFENAELPKHARDKLAFALLDPVRPDRASGSPSACRDWCLPACYQVQARQVGREPPGRTTLAQFPEDSECRLLSTQAFRMHRVCWSPILIPHHPARSISIPKFHPFSQLKSTKQAFAMNNLALLDSRRKTLTDSLFSSSCYDRREAIRRDTFKEPNKSIYQAAIPKTLTKYLYYPDKPILWVSGQAGTGKSSLMFMLTQDNTSHIEKFIGPRFFVVAHFLDKNGKSQDQKTLHGLLSFLLFQLLLFGPNRLVVARLLDQFPDIMEKRKPADWAIEDCLRVLKWFVENLGRPVCFFIDRYVWCPMSA